MESLSDIGSDATHEMLHTLRLEHPFEITQTEDTKLLKVAPNSFVSTSTTDANIVNNIMSYPMMSPLEKVHFSTFTPSQKYL